MKAIGFDIGTTTICGVVTDTLSGEAVCVRTADNDTWLSGEAFERIQDPQKIWKSVQKLYGEFRELYRDIAVIGLTGQMHGIVYVDEAGEAVSPLYTWQDERGNLPLCGVVREDCGMEIGTEMEASSGRAARLEAGKPERERESDGRIPHGEMADGCGQGRETFAGRLSAQTGYSMATGFGLTTHYWNLLCGQVPERAAKLCTIQAYIGMRLTRRCEPLISASDAASLGCFDLERGGFDEEAIRRAGMDTAILPKVECGFALLGETEEEIPVSVAVGDNQASVIGSVKEVEGSLLINIGTSSQVSAGVRGYRAHDGIELRPVAEEDYIFVGAGLCGGRAYAMLEQFFAETVAAMTGEKPEGKLYGRMAELLERRGLGPGTLRADTRFCGTREQPGVTGGIYQITPDSFHPAEVTFGILNGMAEELCAFYRTMRKYGAGQPKRLIGSGNAIRSNPYLRKIFENRFGMKMQIPLHCEEASYGAALFALVSAGRVRSLAEAQRLIRYLDDAEAGEGV